MWEKEGVNAFDKQVEPKCDVLAFQAPLATIGKKATDRGIDGESARNAGYDGNRLAAMAGGLA